MPGITSGWIRQTHQVRQIGSVADRNSKIPDTGVVVPHRGWQDDVLASFAVGIPKRADRCRVQAVRADLAFHDVDPAAVPADDEIHFPA